MGPMAKRDGEAHTRVDEQRDGFTGGASGGDALDSAQPDAGRHQVIEVLAQELPGQDRHLPEVLQRLDAVWRDLVLVEEPPVVARVTVGELQVTAQLGELEIT